MFSGIGGFEYGIEQSYSQLQQNTKKERNKSENNTSFERRKYSKHIERTIWKSKPVCVGFSEIDRYAIATYQKHYPNHENYGNATKINPNELPDFDMLCGGFPCQSFSIAGKRKGFQDTRGTLFHEILRIVAVKRPKLLFLENVKGLLSADDGRCFATIISSLDELGYDIEWQILNSKNFGVPQNRERVFIIGHSREKPSRQIFPIGESNQGNNEKYGKREWFLANTLKARDYKGGGNLIQLNQPKHSNDRVYAKNGLSPSLNTMQGGNSQPKILDLYNHKSHTDRSPTLTEPHHNTIRVQDTQNRIRRLTPTECERLQSFEDGWTEEGINEKGEIIKISDSQRYKMLGNAVTTNVIKAIMEKTYSSI